MALEATKGWGWGAKGGTQQKHTLFFNLMSFVVPWRELRVHILPLNYDPGPPQSDYLQHELQRDIILQCWTVTECKVSHGRRNCSLHGASDATPGPSIIGWGWASLNRTQNTNFLWLQGKQVLLCTVLLAQGCSATPRLLGLPLNWPE